MKFVSAFFALAAFSIPAMARNLAEDQNDNTKIGNTMWHFSQTGLVIFQPDGGTILKSLDEKNICEEYTYNNDTYNRCDWYDVVSDGKQFVYAAVTRNSEKLDIFDINNGNFMGTVDTCKNPRDLEYHSNRNEVWVRCSKTTDTESHMDVINANGIYSNTVANVTVIEGDNNAYGYTVIDSTLGDVGYTTDRTQPFLMKVNLNTRNLEKKIELDALTSGGYEMAYSKVNKHIFIRSTVCCTCGFVGADKGEDCGRYGADNVTVKVGPNADATKLQSGQCGHRCDGIPGVDILGAFEFDTVSEKVLKNWMMADGGSGDPFPSPTGEFIILFGRNGGNTIRILKAGEPGKISTLYSDIKLGFNQTGVEDDQVYNDFAFIEMGDKKMIVFASSTENKMSIVDVSGDVPTQSVVVFGKEGPSTAYRNRRQVEWVRDTNYVWVDGREASEVYVIDIMAGEVVNTITDVSTTLLINVNNWKDAADIAAEQKRVKDLINTQKNNAGAGTVTQTPYKDDNDVDSVGIIGLALGAIALALGAMNLFMFAQVKRFMSGKGGGNNSTPQDDEEVTLGSKNVA